MESAQISWLNLCKQLPLLILYMVQNVLCPPAYLIWYILLLPLKLWNPHWFWKIEGEIYDALLGIVASWSDLSGHSIFESGGDISTLKHDGVLLIANHQTPTDIGTIMKCLHNMAVFQTTNWIMDWIFQYFNFGWVAKCHGDIFLLQGTDARKLPTFLKLGVDESVELQVSQLKTNLKTNNWQRCHKWFILFPEGGLLFKRRAGSQRFAKKRDLPVLENVTYPRLGALQCIVNTLLPQKTTKFNDQPHGIPNEQSDKETQTNETKHLKWLVDITIGYKRSMSSVQYMLGCFGVQETTVHYRIFPIENLLASDHTSVNEDWIYTLFQEKEAYLKHFKEKGCFPKECGNVRQVKSVKIRKVYGIQVMVFITVCALLWCGGLL